MERWQSLIDQEIEKLLQSEDFGNLPGTGKPLNLDNDPSTPNDMRMAYKIMRDNDVAPEWISLGKELEKNEKQLRNKIEQAVYTYQQSLLAPSTKELDRQRIEKQWHITQQSLGRNVDAFNEKVISYNLKTPTGIAHRHLFNLHQEIETLLDS